MDFIIGGQKLSYKINFFFLLAFSFHAQIQPFQLSRSKSSPNILGEMPAIEGAPLQGLQYSNGFRVQAQANRVQLWEKISHPHAIPSSLSLHAETGLINYSTKTTEKNSELLVDRKQLPKKLAINSIKHAPKIIHAIVAMLNNRDNLDFEVLPKKLLLVGEPGTGKTTLGKAIAFACNMPVVKYNASSIADRYKDSGAKNLEKIFHEAAALNTPCVVIIDELEALIKRFDNKNDSESGMLVTLWTLLDEFEDSLIFFVGTLNDVKEAPKQIKNRFSEYIEHLPLPDVVQRKELIEFYMSLYKKMSFANISVDRLVKLTHGFAPRNLRGLLCLACKMSYVRDTKATAIIMSDFLCALKEIDSKAVHLHESWLKRLGDRFLKWGPSTISAINTGVGFLGTGIAIVGLMHSIKTQRENQIMQKEGFSIQKQALDLQAHSLKIQEKSLDLQHPFHRLV